MTTHEDDDVRSLVDRAFQPVPRRGFEQRVLGTLSRASRAVSAAPDARRPGTRRWPARAALAGTGVAVVAAVVAAGLLGPASPLRQAHGTPGAATAAALPSIQTIDARLVAAREAHSDEIVHQTATHTDGTGSVTYRAEYWIWPAAEQPGAEVRARILTPGRSDQEEIFTAPSALNAKGGTATGELIDVDFASRTWSDQKNTTVQQISSAAAVDYRYGIEAGYFRVAGIVRLDGRRAIQLNRVKNGSVLSFQSIYIDAATYLPIEQVSDGGSSGVLEYDIEYLQPTRDNQAKLRPVVPAGFEQTATPPPSPSPYGTR